MMSRYDGGWVPYVSVAERRRKAERTLQKLRKKGVEISPVQLEGRQIAKTFWGKAWCDNLESYRDYESRLPRGRTYVRNGSVIDLHIAPREITAMVSGSDLYQVKVSIGDVAKVRWKALCADCSGGIDSLVELLQGRFSKGVMERICRQDTGLFPRPSEIRFSCSCPDHASMCKHVAAVLYGVGARLDQNPESLFRLRAVDATELLSDLGTALPDMQTGRDPAKTLVGDDLAALFGLEMAASDPPDIVPAAEVPSAGPQLKTRKSVVTKPAATMSPSTPKADATPRPQKAKRRSVEPARNGKVTGVNSEKAAPIPTGAPVPKRAATRKTAVRLAESKTKQSAKTSTKTRQSRSTKARAYARPGAAH